MDFFPGTTSPNFISFCLENQNLDDTQPPTNVVSSVPSETVPEHASSSYPIPPVSSILTRAPPEENLAQVQASFARCPASSDSEPNVTAFADAMAEKMECSQSRMPGEIPHLSLASTKEFSEQAQATLGAESSRSSYPVLPSPARRVTQPMPTFQL